jgi:hypothetical protein
LAFIINKEFHYMTIIQLANPDFYDMVVFCMYLKTGKMVTISFSYHRQMDSIIKMVKSILSRICQKSA